MSPGWQSSASHMASSVEKRIALTLPVFIFDRFTFAMPARSDSSFKDIFRSAMTLSSLSIIGIPHHPHKVSSESRCSSVPYSNTSAKKPSSSATASCSAVMIKTESTAVPAL